MAVAAQVEDIDEPGSYAVVDTINVIVGTSIVIALALAGFVGWRTRSALVAWALVLALIGEIAVAIAMWTL
jgi:hypothetical protein